MASLSFIDDIVRGFGGFLEAVSPIDLFNKDQVQKLSYKFGEVLKNPSKSTLNEYGRELGVGVSAAMARKAHYGRSMNMAEYFQGYKFDRPASAFTPGELALNRNVRVGTAAALGIYGASSLMLGDDSLPSKVSGTVLGAAVHGGIAKALYKGTNPAIGLAYGGLGLVNMMRKGDNYGPF